MTRDEAKQQVTSRGGLVVSAVGPKVDYVVSGEESGSKLTKAKQLGITVISPQEFEALLQEGSPRQTNS